MHIIKDRGFTPGRGDIVTPKAVYARREFLMQAAAGGAMAAGFSAGPALACRCWFKLRSPSAARRVSSAPTPRRSGRRVSGMWMPSVASVLGVPAP